MHVRLLESSMGGDALSQNATSYIINDTLAVDAGALGFWGSSEDQSRIRHLLITHSHADHVATLPIFLENAYEAKPDCVTVWGNTVVLKCIREDILNNRFWPDFEALSPPNAPFLHLRKLEREVSLELEGIRVTPILVDHTVRNYGMVLEDENSACIIVSDTAPTKRIWEVANSLPNLKAVFLEAAFPNHMHELAKISMHLTPEMFGGEVAKLKGDPRVLAVHLKPRYRDLITSEVLELGYDNVEFGVPGLEYDF